MSALPVTDLYKAASACLTFPVCSPRTDASFIPPGTSLSMTVLSYCKQYAEELSAHHISLSETFPLCVPVRVPVVCSGRVTGTWI